MKKINLIAIMFTLVMSFVACEKENNEISTVESSEVTSQEAIDLLEKSNNGDLLFVENLEDVEGTWEVTGISVVGDRDFSPVDQLESDRLFFPASSNELVEVNFIRIANGQISLLDSDGSTELNSFGLTNLAFGNTVIAGLFNVDLSSVASGFRSRSRISITFVDGNLRLGQPFNRRDRVEYELESL